MHELSIAMSILDIAEAEAERSGETGVVAIHLKLGPLSGVVKEALISAFNLAREGTAMTESELIVEDVPLVVFCPVCGINREIPSVQYLCCPICDTPTAEIITGREMDVVSMEVST